MSDSVTPCTAAHRASLSFTVFQSLLRLIHVRWVDDTIQPSHPLSSPFSSCLQSFPASGSFPMSQFFASGGQSIGASALELPMNIQGWFPLELTDLISLQSESLKSLLQHHSSKVSLSFKLLLEQSILGGNGQRWRVFGFMYSILEHSCFWRMSLELSVLELLLLVLSFGNLKRVSWDGWSVTC